MNFDIHKENREEIINFLKADLLGPASLSKYIKFEDLDTTNQEIHFEKVEDTYHCFRDKNSNEEILKIQPTSSYSLGILYPENLNIEEEGEEDISDVLDQKEIDVTEIDSLNSETSNKENIFFIKDQKKNKKNKKYDDDDETDVMRLTHQRKPSAMGISFRFDLENSPSLKITISGAFYQSFDVFRKWEYENDTKKVKIRSSEGFPKFKSFYKRIPIVHEFEYLASEIVSSTKDGFLEDRTIEVLGNKLVLKLYIRKYQNSYIGTATLLNKSSENNPDFNSFYQSKIQIEILDKDNFPHILPYPEYTDTTEDILEPNEDNTFSFIYKKMFTYAIGHGTSVVWKDTPDKNSITKVSTEFLPEHEIQPLTPDIINSRTGKPYQISMKELSEGGGMETIKELIDDYEKWIYKLENKEINIEKKYKNVFYKNIELCKEGFERIQKGFQYLTDENFPKAKKAFMLMNEALYLQQNIPNQIREANFNPSGSKINFQEYELWKDEVQKNLNIKGFWRPFQIAFILLTVDSIINEKSDSREIVDLLWFPTGGGKTEAYLGITAFTLFYTRLVNQMNNGVQAIMRYTLRLLTAQQFERASKLIMCVEHIRRKNIDELGGKEYSIGIWVGNDVISNTMKSALIDYEKFIRKGAKAQYYKFLLQACPFCRAQMGPLRYEQYKNASQEIIKNPEYRVIGITKTNDVIKLSCPDKKCEFNTNFPVYMIDDDIYEKQPSLIIATVDKFANLIWKEETRRIFGIGDSGEREKPPPVLIIQDELHLISNALGSTFGFFETLIEDFCSFVDDNNKVIKPKIVCSTATIRNSKEQILGLFGREKSFLFPSSGEDISDSFFSQENQNVTGKKYLGLTLPVLSSQEAQARILSNLLQVPLFFESDHEKDPWWTNLNYFHSIRELGTTWSIYHDDVQKRLAFLFNRFQLGWENKQYKPWDSEIVELTSRISSTEVVESIKKMEQSKVDTKRPLRAILATSIVEVGVDIQRLSLLTILGQPKNTSQYIQVAGRVGRSNASGLVVTIFGVGRPRDISHYEKFKSYHQKLYASVEPTSVTPFSIAATERFIDGALFMYLRSKLPVSSFARNPEQFPHSKISELKHLIITKAEKTKAKQHEIDYLLKLFDNLEYRWKKTNAVAWIAKDYNLNEKDPPLLTAQGEYAANVFENSFHAPNSMRTVEQTSRPKIVNDFESFDHGR